MSYCCLCSNKINDQSFKLNYSCSHSFCILCSQLSLIQYFTMSTNDSLSPCITIGCLMCHEGQKEINVKELNQYYLIRSSLEINDHKVNMTERKCDECLNRKSHIYCETCSSYLCKKCDIHNKYSYLKAHKIIYSVEQQIKINNKSNIKELADEMRSKTESKLVEERNNICSFINKLKALLYNITTFQMVLSENIEFYDTLINNITEKNNLKTNIIQFLIENDHSFNNPLFINNKAFNNKIDNLTKSLNNPLEETSSKNYDDILSSVDTFESNYNKIKDELILFKKHIIENSNVNFSQNINLANLNVCQNIECENIQIIHRPNVFSCVKKNNSLLLIWPEKNHEIIVYDIISNEMKACLKSHNSQVSSIKNNNKYFLTTGSENIIWSLEDYSLIAKIDNIGICLTGDIILDNIIVLIANTIKSDVMLYNINGQLIFNIKQDSLVLNINYWKNPFTNDSYLQLSGMNEKEVGQCQTIQIDVDKKSFSLQRVFIGSQSCFVLKSYIFFDKGHFNIIIISQDGDLRIYCMESSILIKQIKFYSLCDFCVWDNKSIILLGDELNNYIVFSLSNHDVVYMINKDHSYSINAMRIGYINNKDALIVLDSNSNFKIFN